MSINELLSIVKPGEEEKEPLTDNQHTLKRPRKVRGVNCSMKNTLLAIPVLIALALTIRIFQMMKTLLQTRTMISSSKSSNLRPKSPLQWSLNFYGTHSAKQLQRPSWLLLPWIPCDAVHKVVELSADSHECWLTS